MEEEVKNACVKEKPVPEHVIEGISAANVHVSNIMEAIQRIDASLFGSSVAPSPPLEEDGLPEGSFNQMIYLLEKLNGSLSDLRIKIHSIELIVG